MKKLIMVLCLLSSSAVADSPQYCDQWDISTMGPYDPTTCARRECDFANNVKTHCLVKMYQNDDGEMVVEGGIVFKGAVKYQQK